MEQKTPSVCEESAFSGIFREYAETLHHYLFYKTGDHGLSQDLVQEAFSRLWKNCQTVLFSTAKGYVFKTANNLLLNEYEHQKVRLRFEQVPRSGLENENPEYLLEEKELRQRLEAAIAALPEKQRLVFLLSRIDKKTYQEIADLLEISRQAVEKRMYNALDSLRKVSAKIK